MTIQSSGEGRTYIVHITPIMCIVIEPILGLVRQQLSHLINVCFTNQGAE